MFGLSSVTHLLLELYLFLSSLVKEYYRTSGEAPYSTIGADVGHLILERLPLFLHEHPQSGITVSLNWLNKEKNFIVRVFGKLLVTKLFMTIISTELKVLKLWGYNGASPTTFIFLRWLTCYSRIS